MIRRMERERAIKDAGGVFIIVTFGKTKQLDSGLERSGESRKITLFQRFREGGSEGLN